MANLKNIPDTIDWSRVQGPWEPPFRETQIISAQIAEKSTDFKAQVEFLSSIISEWNGSVQRQNMDVAQRYYENNDDIKNATRTVIGRSVDEGKPQLIRSEVLANNTLSHNFLKKLTRQKIGYLLGQPFLLSAAKKDDSVAEQFIERCKESYMGKSFFKTIKNVARDSIIKGIGWLLVYYDENGDLKFRRCEPENVIPLWKDADHSVLDAVLYKYNVEVYTGGEKEIITHVDYYTENGITHYIWNVETELLERVGSRADPATPYFGLRKLTTNEEGEEIWMTQSMNWTKIPFIPFKYDPDEQSLLERIKDLVDDYDKHRSLLSNNIEDFPNSMTVVRNYDGEDKEEFTHNKNVFRTMFVTGDGDAKSLETPLNIVDINAYLDKLKNDIYEAAQGVNTSNKDIRDTSGTALRFLYADLDLDCLDWGSELEWSLMELFWFIQQDIYIRYGEDFTNVQYGVEYKTVLIINETEKIQAALQSVGVISQRTIVENHPWVQDVEKELADMKEELEENLELKDEYAEAPSNPAQSQKETLGQA